jgi:hypothetical protein
MIGGLAYSNDLTQWLTYKPSDPLNNLAAFAHIYNFNTCSNTSCYDSQIGPGRGAGAAGAHRDRLRTTARHGVHRHAHVLGRRHGVGYLGWTWNTWTAATGPVLITDYNGTATPSAKASRTASTLSPTNPTRTPRTPEPPPGRVDHGPQHDRRACRQLPPAPAPPAPPCLPASPAPTFAPTPWRALAKDREIPREPARCTQARSTPVLRPNCRSWPTSHWPIPARTWA